MTLEAVIFDLDDTLYRERRYVLSGFAAVAREVGQRHGVAESDAFRAMAGALRRGLRAQAFQVMGARVGLDLSQLPHLVHVMRTHEPRIRLSATARRVLAAVRAACPTAILTNGLPGVQARKVRALGLEPLVDQIVYAVEHGTGAGKPEAAPFLEVCARLGVHPRHCVFVGNDPERDISGARALGMRTVRVGCDTPPPGVPDADVHVGGIGGVAAALAHLAGDAGLTRAWRTYPKGIQDAA